MMSGDTLTKHHGELQDEVTHVSREGAAELVIGGDCR